MRLWEGPGAEPAALVSGVRGFGELLTPSTGWAPSEKLSGYKRGGGQASPERVRAAPPPWSPSLLGVAPSALSVPETHPRYGAYQGFVPLPPPGELRFIDPP